MNAFDVLGFVFECICPFLLVFLLLKVARTIIYGFCPYFLIDTEDENENIQKYDKPDIVEVYRSKPIQGVVLKLYSQKMKGDEEKWNY